MYTILIEGPAGSVETDARFDDVNECRRAVSRLNRSDERPAHLRYVVGTRAALQYDLIIH